VQGRTLGPLEGKEITLGLKSGDFLANDKIADSRNPSWQIISEHPYFGRFVSTDAAPLSQQIALPTSPRLLRNRSQAVPVERSMAIAASPILPHSPAPEIIETKIDTEEPAAELAESTKEIKSYLSSLKKIETPEVVPAAVQVAIPRRPEYEPIFIAPAEPLKSSPKKAASRVIQIELRLPDRPWKWVVVLTAIAIAAVFYLEIGMKTRDLKDSRLPDPSSPMNTPFETGDPIPPLKAPTRPKRE